MTIALLSYTTSGDVTNAHRWRQIFPLDFLREGSIHDIRSQRGGASLLPGWIAGLVVVAAPDGLASKG